ncbi:hypothetical protein BGZ68_008177 [Mortierella alpina]|nr:hypothetical protein BGZ68_008177 [Mortierella alpina]
MSPQAETSRTIHAVSQNNAGPDDGQTPQEEALPSDISFTTDIGTGPTESASRPGLVIDPKDEDPNFGPKSPLTTARRVLVFLGISVTIFLSALDQTIVTTTLPAIATEFSDFTDIAWVGTAYLISTTAVQPLYGITSNMFGRKRTMLFACTVFLLGSTLCGSARSMLMLIISRAVQGLGGSGIIALAYIITADIVPLRQRGGYQGAIAMVYALAGVLGPLLGGVFSDYASWRWAFYINLPTGAVAVMMLVLFLHLQRPRGVPFWANVMSLDFSGIFFLVVSVTLILLGLNWGAVAKFAWNSSAVLSVLIVGLLSGILFLLNEWRCAKQPIIPLRLFGTWSLAATYVDVFLQGFIFLGLLFFLPMYYQAVHGASAVQSGIELMPFVIAQSLVAVVVGMLMSRWGIYKEFTVAGFAVGTLAGGLMTLLDESTSKGILVVILTIAGVSQGLSVTSVLLGIHAQVKNQKDIAFGTSLWTFLRTFGGVFGIAVGNAFLQSSLKRAGMESYARDIKAIVTLPEDLKRQVLRAFMRGLHEFFVLMAVLSGLGFLASLMINKVKLEPRKKQQDQDGETSGGKEIITPLGDL